MMFFGANFSKSAKHSLLNPTETKELVRRAQHQDAQAIKVLAKHNLRLVISIAQYYQNQGLDFEDLIQEGILGLLKSFQKFDPSKGFALSTYATWWVKQAIRKALANRRKHDYTSLDEKAVDDESIKLIDLIEDHRPSIEDVLRHDEHKRVVQSLLQGLDSLERAIVILRYGLDAGGKRRTLEAVASVLQIQKTTVAAIHNRILKKMKSKLPQNLF